MILNELQTEERSGYLVRKKAAAKRGKHNMEENGMELAKRQELFENPTREYRGKPFWSWNGKLEEAEL